MCHPFTAASNIRDAKPFENGKQSSSDSTANLLSAIGKSSDEVRKVCNLHRFADVFQDCKITFFFPTRTNTYPKIPERYRLKSTDGTLPSNLANINQSTPTKTRSVSLHGQSPSQLTKLSPSILTNSNNNGKAHDSGKKDDKEQNKEEEVIYF